MTSSEKYYFIGNNLAIDLVNTLIAARGKPAELLQSSGDVIEWADAAGLMLRTKPGVGLLESVIDLRSTLKAIFDAKLARRGAPRGTLTSINRYLIFYRPAQQLRTVEDELQLGPINKRLTKEELLGKVAYEAAQLLVSPAVEQLKKCESQKCVLLFLDTSRAHRRRWCSMKLCGNRAKVASHYKSSKA